jgi:hypothetical protein
MTTPTEEERYEECDRCGERYWGEDFIRSYLRDEESGGELLRVCCPKPAPSKAMRVCGECGYGYVLPTARRCPDCLDPCPPASHE